MVKSKHFVPFTFQTMMGIEVQIEKVCGLKRVEKEKKVRHMKKELNIHTKTYAVS